MAGNNCCRRRELKKRYGDRMIYHCGSYYLRDEQPAPGQGEPSALPDGTPIRFLAWFMAIEPCEWCQRAGEGSQPLQSITQSKGE